MKNVRRPQTNSDIYLEYNFLSLYSLILVIFYGEHMFKLITAYFLINGKFREPTNPNSLLYECQV